MIVATAKHWVNYNGVWHPKGDEFPVDEADLARMEKHADIERKPEPPETNKRGRRRKE